MKIALQNVKMAYDGKTVFSNLTYTFCLTGITALMGESGCGKTTLLRLLCGLEAPKSGKIVGMPQKYTFMFQENRLLPWATALENVSAVCNVPTARQWLAAVGLSQEANSLPSALSGGMQRRVAFARALAHQSDVLLLDEPFKGLDVELRSKMIQLLRQQAKVRPILFVTHDPCEAQECGAEVLDFQQITRNA